MSTLDATFPSAYGQRETLRLAFTVPGLDDGEGLSSVEELGIYEADGETETTALVIRETGRDASGSRLSFWLDPSAPGRYVTRWLVSTDLGQTLDCEVEITIE